MEDLVGLVQAGGKISSLHIELAFLLKSEPKEPSNESEY